MSDKVPEILHSVPKGCECYVSVYHAFFGWKAVMLVLSHDEDFGDFWEPESTTYFQYPEPARAIEEGRRWAADSEVPFVCKKDLI